MGVTPWLHLQEDNALAGEISRSLRLLPITARALIRRGAKSVEDAERFIHPLRLPASDAGLLPDATAAVEQICGALKRGERIAVYGDYDADGVCATAIMLKTLRRLGGDAVYLLPSRHEEGYGLHKSAVDRLYALGAKLLITVDNGVSASEEIDYVLGLGMGAIVTDHHLPGENMPRGVPLVCPTRADSVYPEPFLCGAGVAYKLARLLDPEGDAAQLLAIAAVATVADVVPLIGENRAIVARGLPLINAVPGFQALLEAAGLDHRPMNEGVAAFGIAPRLNACGRVSRPDEALELIMSDDPVRCVDLALKLEEYNRTRRELENEASQSAEEQTMGQLRQRALVAVGEDWNPGVIGIVASRIAEKCHRVVFVFTGSGDELTGSARSLPGVHLVDCIRDAGRYTLRFGGHERAAGVSLKRDMLDSFGAAVNEYLENNYAPEAFERQVLYEEQATLEQVTTALAEELRMLAPFGEGNPEPALLFEDVQFSNVRVIGKDKRHLSATMHGEGGSIRCVYFGGAGLAELLEQGSWRVVAAPSVNSFGGRDTAELTLRALFRPETETMKEMGAFLEHCLYNSGCGCDKMQGMCSPSALKRFFGGIALDLEHMRLWYRGVRAFLSDGPKPVEELISLLDPGQAFALLVFHQLGFVGVDSATRWATLKQNAPGRDLEQSGLYRRFMTIISEKETV